MWFSCLSNSSRSTCIKCPSSINLLLVLKPRLFGQGYPTDITLTVRNSLTTTDLTDAVVSVLIFFDLCLSLNKDFSFYGFLRKSWICGITTCVHVSFFVRECDYFLLCPPPGGGGYSLWWPIRGGSARNPGEVLNKYLYEQAPPQDPTPYPSRKRSIFVNDSYFMTVQVSSS